MATAHLIVDGKEVAARKMVLKRHVNVESLESWWRVARKSMQGKDLPLTYEKAEVDVAYIRFVCKDGTIIFVDRKRDML